MNYKLIRNIVLIVALIAVVASTVVFAYKNNSVLPVDKTLENGSEVNEQLDSGADNSDVDTDLSNNEGENKNKSDGSTEEGKEASDESNTNKPENASPTPQNPSPTPTPVKKDINVKALYLTGWTVGIDSKLKHYIDLANTTEINSYVIDIKDDDGLVGYETDVQAVREIGAWTKKYDPDKVLKELHENDIYVIGRLVCFKDPVASSKMPELAIKNINRGLWKEKNSDGKYISWLSPYNKASWPYLIEIAKEAVKKGFDEIQFDYVRFPNTDRRLMDFGNVSETKYDTINEFLSYAKEQLPGVPISADVFGIICESPKDTEDIGQYLELVGKEIDFISPMLYPSHYAVGQSVNGVRFVKPDLKPYDVVYNSLAKAKDRISQVEGYNADVRPYLQDFTASWLGDGYYQQYGPEQVKQQIQAVYDAGYEQWIFWDSFNTYSEAAFKKETNN